MRPVALNEEVLRGDGLVRDDVILRVRAFDVVLREVLRAERELLIGRQLRCQH